MLAVHIVLTLNVDTQVPNLTTVVAPTRQKFKNIAQISTISSSFLTIQSALTLPHRLKTMAMQKRHIYLQMISCLKAKVDQTLSASNKSLTVATRQNLIWVRVQKVRLANQIAKGLQEAQKCHLTTSKTT